MTRAGLGVSVCWSESAESGNSGSLGGEKGRENQLSSHYLYAGPVKL